MSSPRRSVFKRVPRVLGTWRQPSTAARISAWACPVLLPVPQKYKARNTKDTETSCPETEVISASREACLSPHLLRAGTAGHPGGLGSPAWALTACWAPLVRTQSSYLAPADPAALLCTGLQIYGVFCHLIKDAPAGASMAAVQGGDDLISSSRSTGSRSVTKAMATRQSQTTECKPKWDFLVTVLSKDYFFFFFFSTVIFMTRSQQEFTHGFLETLYLFSMS